MEHGSVMENGRVIEQAIVYEIDGRKCEGMLVCDERMKKMHPVILL